MLLRLIALVVVLLATGCSVPDSGPGFKSIDISGADYAADFSLTDHNGVPRTLADFKGKVVSVFFGYTQCPDVCPTSLSTMAEVMRLLGKDAERVQVLFITVDPERDTRELLSQYVPAFDPRFLGLYADLAGTESVARSFKIFHQKSGDTSGPNYTVDHSAGTYIYDSEGRVRLYVKHGAPADDVAADIHELLAGR